MDRPSATRQIADRRLHDRAQEGRPDGSCTGHRIVGRPRPMAARLLVEDGREVTLHARNNTRPRRRPRGAADSVGNGGRRSVEYFGHATGGRTGQRPRAIRRGHPQRRGRLPPATADRDRRRFVPRLRNHATGERLIGDDHETIDVAVGAAVPLGQRSGHDHGEHLVVGGRRPRPNARWRFGDAAPRSLQVDRIMAGGANASHLGRGRPPNVRRVACP